MAKSRGRKFAEITSPASGVFDITSVPTITNAKLQNSAMTLAGSSVSLGGTGVANTDALSEGSSNVYFTDARVQTFLGGGTLAGNVVVPDNRSIYLGSSSDFRMVHNTTNTQLINATGALQITSNGGFDVTGATTFSADLTVDTSTLKVDSSNNRVGIGTASPATPLHTIGITTFDGDGSSRAEITSSTASSIVSLDVGGFNGTPSLARDIRFLTNAASNAKTLRMTISSGGHLIPGADSSYNIGTNATRFANAYFDTMYGTVGTVAQPNITSVGTLTALTMSGALTLNTGNSGVPTINLSHSNSGADNFRIMAGITGVSNSGFSIYDVDASANRLVINSNGQLFIGDGSPQWPTGTIGNSAGRHMFHYNGDTVLLLWDESTGAQGNTASLFLGGKPVGSSNYFSGGAIYGNVENGSNASGELVLKTTNTNGGLATALTINSSQAATFTGDVQAAGLYVGSTNAAYDFYNNGTGYNNGAFTVDDALTVTGTVSGGVLTSSAAVNSVTVDTGTLYVGNNNTELSENNLYAKSGGHFYIDHNTVGQDFIFRVSNSSSRDMYGPRFFASGKVSVGPDNSTTSAHQMKINSTTMGLRIKSGSGGYSSLTWSGDGENTIGSITTSTNQIYFGSQNSGGTGSNGELLVEPRSGSNKRVLTLKSTGNIHGPIDGGPLSFAGLGSFNIMDMEREWLDTLAANSGSDVTSHTSTSNVQGPSMSHPGASGNGYSKIKYADHPTAGVGAVLESVSGSSSTWNGGWNSSTFTVDQHKPYLYTCYVRRTSSDVETSGTFYFGLYNAYPQGTSTTVNTNPYMIITSASNLVRYVWHLVYCMVYPRTYSGTGINPVNPGDMRGLWRIDNMDRRAGQTGWRNYQDSQQMRSYLYYSGNGTTTLQWARPGVWVMDGNQPTFADLINAHGIHGVND